MPPSMNDMKAQLFDMVNSHRDNRDELEARHKQEMKDLLAQQRQQLKSAVQQLISAGVPPGQIPVHIKILMGLGSES